MAGVDPTNPFGDLPPDLQALVEQANMRRQLALRMQQQFLSPQNPTNPGPIASRVSPLAPLLQALGSYMTGKQAEEAGTAISNAGQQYQQRLQTERNPLEGETPQARISRLLASQYGQNRSIGQGLSTEMHNRTVEEISKKDLDRKVAKDLADNTVDTTRLANDKAYHDAVIRQQGAQLAEQARFHNIQASHFGAETANAAERNSIMRAQLDQGKTPAGYERNPDAPGLRPVPGGPADMKVQGAFNQDTAALSSSVNSLDNLATEANALLQHPGLKGATGVRGAIPNIPGSDAANFDANLNSLKGRIGFAALQEMRNASKTGGALGSVSDAEGKKLDAAIAALDKSQSPKQMQDNLAKVIQYSNEAKDRLAAAYQLKHGNQTGAAPVAPPPKAEPRIPSAGTINVQSQADFDALPSGTVFVGPDGKKRKKP